MRPRALRADFQLCAAKFRAGRFGRRAGIGDSGGAGRAGGERLGTANGGDQLGRRRARSGGGRFSLLSLGLWQSRRISELRRFTGSVTRINAYVPVADGTSVPQAAEILVLDPDPSSVTLGTMP